MGHQHGVVQIDLAALPDDPDLLQQMLREVVPELQAENEKLWQLIQRLLRHRYGPRSEKLDLDQLQLVLEDAEQSAAESDAAKNAAEPSERRRRIAVANRNRGALPAHLPRDEVVIDVENKDCPCCGGALHLIGEDRSEMLDLVPAQLRVKVVCRPRYGCRSCEGAVVQAAAPERPIDGGMATEALIAHVVISKFCDSLPLYRQAQMLKRQGITLDRSTLSAWVGRACWWLTPLYELVLGTVLSSDKVFADETTLPVLEPGRGKTRTGRLWCCHRRVNSRQIGRLKNRHFDTQATHRVLPERGRSEPRPCWGHLSSDGSGETLGGQVGGADRDIGAAPAGDDCLGDCPAHRSAPEHGRKIHRTWHRAADLRAAAAATDEVGAI